MGSESDFYENKIKGCYRQELTVTFNRNLSELRLFDFYDILFLVML